jgi:enterobactin synthetase component F
VDCDLLYFHATHMTGNLEGILNRHPSGWVPFVRGIQVHELACHHEAVLNPLPAAQIGRRLQERLAMQHPQCAQEAPAVTQPKTRPITAAWG